MLNSASKIFVLEVLNFLNPKKFAYRRLEIAILKKRHKAKS